MIDLAIYFATAAPLLAAWFSARHDGGVILELEHGSIGGAL